MTSSFVLALHAHIPWCRKSGTWPAGEEWLHEAIIECYLPMFKVLDHLSGQMLGVKVNIEFTPVLLEQLADPYMQGRFVEYVEGLLERARGDVARFEKRPRLKETAMAYVAWFSEALDLYRGRLKKDIIGAYRRLQEEGVAELFTSAATHGFLPLLARDSSVRAQLATGVEVHKKYFGRRPRGVWLPECAFRPLVHQDGRARAGIDDWIKRVGLEYFIVNYTGIDMATLRAVNPRGPRYKSTYEAYALAGTGMVVFGRNFETSEQVWSADKGYPGNPVYKEFHVKDQISGLRYLAISGRGVPKDVYEPAVAVARAREDGLDFARLVESRLAEYKKINNRDGIIVSPYDFELFGHWWAEGTVFLESALETLVRMDDVELVTFSRYLDESREEMSEITLEKTSWGEGGDFRVWLNQQHGWVWPLINDASTQLEQLLARNGVPSSDYHARLLRQAARELLLLQGSDWPFLLYTDQAREYANQRFHWHHQRLNMLLWAAKDPSDGQRLPPGFLEEVEGIDNCFPDIDVSLFKPVPE